MNFGAIGKALSSGANASMGAIKRNPIKSAAIGGAGAGYAMGGESGNRLQEIIAMEAPREEKVAMTAQLLVENNGFPEEQALQMADKIVPMR